MGVGSRVYVGMSGGVDSALAAALLVEQGYDVTGVYMRNWSRDLPGFACPWADDLADAERVAVSLGIELVVWDCEKDYRRTVVDYVVDAYARGYTPNPDVMCNQTIKFGTFARKAFAEGADYIATGHYARVCLPQGECAAGSAGVSGLAGRPGPDSAHGPAEVPGPAAAPGAPSSNGTPGLAAAPRSSLPKLLRSTNEHKDQTYFLWRVPARVLGRVLFPVGEIATKDEVRAMCAERGLEVATKPDSDGICFVGPVGLRTFLLDSLDRKVGDVVEWETGKVLGKHDGAFLFTVGQRRGLNLGGGPARYVVDTNVAQNVVYVTANRQCPALWTREVALEDVRWIAGTAPEPGSYLVRLRHTGPLVEAKLEPRGDMCVARIASAVQRVAPGQSCVVYDGVECLGGGMVAREALARPGEEL